MIVPTNASNASCMQPLYDFHNKGLLYIGDEHCCIVKALTINDDDCCLVKIAKLTTIIFTAIAHIIGSLFDCCKSNASPIRPLSSRNLIPETNTSAITDAPQTPDVAAPPSSAAAAPVETLTPEPDVSPDTSSAASAPAETPVLAPDVNANTSAITSASETPDVTAPASSTANAPETTDDEAGEITMSTKTSRSNVTVDISEDEGEEEIIGSLRSEEDMDLDMPPQSELGSQEPDFSETTKEKKGIETILSPRKTRSGKILEPRRTRL